MLTPVGFSAWDPLLSFAFGDGEGRGVRRDRRGDCARCMLNLNTAPCSAACPGRRGSGGPGSRLRCHSVPGWRGNHHTWRHLLCLSLRSCDCVLMSTPAPFHARPPLLPCVIKQRHQTKPRRALLRCVSVMSAFSATCLACLRFAASHQRWVWRGLEGCVSKCEPRPWGRPRSRWEHPA